MSLFLLLLPIFLPLTLTQPMPAHEFSLEEEAISWAKRAHQQGQRAAESPLPDWKRVLANKLPLTAEPSRGLIREAIDGPSERAASPWCEVYPITAGKVETDEAIIFSAQVQARAGEDRGEIHIRRSDQSTLMAIFDGHSRRSSKNKGCSELAARHFGPLFFDLMRLGDKPLAVFREVIRVLQKVILEANMEDGSAAMLCYHDLSKDTLFGCTLGDSLATLYSFSAEGIVISRLSYIETWADPVAIARVPREEGWEINNGYLRRGGRGLALTRALGDAALGPAVSQEPILWKRSLSATPWALVLSSDGLTDWLSEWEVGTLLRNWLRSPELYKNYSNVAELLVAKARERAHTYCEEQGVTEPDRHIDDITVIVRVDRALLIPGARG